MRAHILADEVGIVKPLENVLPEDRLTEEALGINGVGIGSALLVVVARKLTVEGTVAARGGTEARIKVCLGRLGTHLRGNEMALKEKAMDGIWEAIFGVKRSKIEPKKNWFNKFLDNFR